MRLIELSANKQSFRTVRFNRTGLSLVIGKKANPEDRDLKNSTNGVGKSLLLYLIDFCLGSKENAELKNKLPEWEFRLKVELDGKESTVTRSTENQGEVHFNGVPLELKKYNSMLASSIFQMEEPVKYLTFRSLIGLFLRQGKGAYLSYEKVNEPEDSRTQLLRSSYLLGLDIGLVARKRELREEQKKIADLRKSFGKEGFLREYLAGDKDARLELKDLDEKAKDLQDKVDNFKVAENYEEIQQGAQQTKRSWRRATEKLHRLNRVLHNIDRSLKEQPDLNGKIVSDTFKALGKELPDLVCKRLEEVSEFHSNLVQSRMHRLTTEKHSVERDIDSTKNQIAKLDAKKDEYFQYLGSHGALAEYEALVNSLNAVKKQAEKLREFKKLDTETKRHAQKCKLELQEENVRANEYLDASEKHISKILDRFRSMSRRIYPSHPSGLLIENNEGNNLQRFDIEAKIDSDTSDGIGEVKLFCFDMTVLTLQQNHVIQFLAHDNRLYPGIDPRQRAEVFRIASEYGQDNGVQYIATINEVDLKAMREVMNADDYEALFPERSRVLELSDDKEEGKLLGISVDLSYFGKRKESDDDS